MIGRALPIVVAAAALAGCGGDGAAAPPRVLAVQVPEALQRTGEHATAFATGAGRVVTAAHVIHAGAPVRAAARRARVLRIDRRLDVALLAVPGVRGPALRRASARAGQRVAVRVIRAGRARSLQATVRRTIVARLAGVSGRVRVRPALELAAAVAPGDSGAPVLDRRGRLVGVVFAAAADREALAYAVDAKALGRILRGSDP